MLSVFAYVACTAMWHDSYKVKGEPICNSLGGPRWFSLNHYLGGLCELLVLCIEWVMYMVLAANMKLYLKEVKNTGYYSLDFNI